MIRSRWLVALFAVLVVAGSLFAPQTSRAAEAPFVDLTGSPYREAIETLYRLGLVSGRTPNTYAPEGNVTRAEMAVLLVRAAKPQEQAATPAPFADLPTDHWSAPAVRQASALGWIKGDGGRFRPADPVTQAEALTMVLRAAGQAGDVTGPWPDAYIAKASTLGLAEGLPLNPGAVLNRGEAAQVLYNWIVRPTVVTPAPPPAEEPAEAPAPAEEPTPAPAEPPVPAVIETLTLTPVDAVAVPRIPLRLEVRGNGQPLAPGSVEWRVDGIQGVLDTITGEFTAKAAGSGTITAKLGQLTATTKVTVTGPLARLAASFDRTRIAADGKGAAVLTVRLLDDKGTVLPVDGRVITVESYGLATELSATSLRTAKGVATLTVKGGITEGVIRLKLTSGDLPVEAAYLTVGPQKLGAIKLQALNSRVSDLSGASPIVFIATLLDEANQPMVATEEIRLRLVASPKPANVGSYVTSIGRMTIPKGAVGVVEIASPYTSDYAVRGLTVWGVRDDQPENQEPATNKVGISVVSLSPGPATVQVAPAFVKAPADGKFKVPVIGMVLGPSDVVLSDGGVDDLDFTVTGPGGSTKFSLDGIGGVTQFHLPPQTKPGLYTVTEKSGKIKPFTVEYFAVEP